jgi:hypothetical protein
MIDADDDHRRDPALPREAQSDLVESPFVVAHVAEAGIEQVLPVQHVQHRVAAVALGRFVVAFGQQHADRALVSEDTALQRVQAQVAADRRLAGRLGRVGGRDTTGQCEHQRHREQGGAQHAGRFLVVSGVVQGRGVQVPQKVLQTRSCAAGGNANPAASG